MSVTSQETHSRHRTAGSLSILLLIYMFFCFLKILCANLKLPASVFASSGYSKANLCLNWTCINSFATKIFQLDLSFFSSFQHEAFRAAFSQEMQLLQLQASLASLHASTFREMKSENDLQSSKIKTSAEQKLIEARPSLSGNIDEPKDDGRVQEGTYRKVCPKHEGLNVRQWNMVVVWWSWNTCWSRVWFCSRTMIQNSRVSTSEWFS